MRMLVGCAACLLLIAACLEKVAPTTGTPHLQGMLWRDDDARFKRSTAEFSKCNYWLSAALQHIDSPADFLSDPSSHYHSHVHCAHCPKH